MGSKFPVLKARECVNALRKLGFEPIRQNGNHMRFVRHKHDRRYIVTVPNHREIDKGTLVSIMEQAGITLEELLQVL